MRTITLAIVLLLLAGCGVSNNWYAKYGVDEKNLMSQSSVEGQIKALKSRTHDDVMDAFNIINSTLIKTNALNEAVVEACYTSSSTAVVQSSMEYFQKTGNYIYLLRTIKKGLSIYHHRTQALASRYAIICVQNIDITPIMGDLQKVTTRKHHRRTRKNANQAISLQIEKNMAKSYVKRTKNATPE
jgi:hypothetical protein